MIWPKIAAENRACIAWFFAAVIFAAIFIAAPANDYRVTAVAIIVGMLTSVISWQHFPGWDIFTAGSAFAIVGVMQPVLPCNWIMQASLLLPATICWYLGARLGEEWIVFPFGYDDNYGTINWQRLRKENFKGGIVSFTVCFLTLIVFTPFIEAFSPLAFPWALCITYATCARWTIRRPLWPVIGILAALPMGGLIAQIIYAHNALSYPAAANPWLLGGLSILGSVLGVWLAKWRAQLRLELNAK